MNIYDLIKDILNEYDKELLNRYSTNSIYHYTSGEGLQKIIETHSLRLTERNFMNDIRETEYTNGIYKSNCDKLGIELFDSGSDQKIQDINSMNYLNRGNFQFIFSTTIEKDSIHMWSSYSNKDAYAIEFDRDELETFFRRHNFLQKTQKENFFYGLVIYDNKIQNQIMFDVLKKAKEKFIEFNFSESELYNMVADYFRTMYKQDGHSCESEFRFVFNTNISEVKSRLRTSKHDPGSSFFFIHNRGLIVPILSIDFEHDKLPIRSIKIGPYNREFEITKRSLLNFLDCYGYDTSKIAVTVSDLEAR